MPPLDISSIWGGGEGWWGTQGVVELGDRCSTPPFHSPSPPTSHQQPVFLPPTCLGHGARGVNRGRGDGEAGGEWLCACHTSGLATACQPPPPLPKPKTKGWLEAGCLPGGGTQCGEAGRPDDRGPPITCPLDENERQGASGAYVSECVTLGFTSRLGGGVGRGGGFKTIGCIIN